MNLYRELATPGRGRKLFAPCCNGLLTQYRELENPRKGTVEYIRGSLIEEQLRKVKRGVWMGYLYVCEQGASIGIADNRFQVKYRDGMIKSIPAETLEVIEVFGKVQITTQCRSECLRRGVNIL